MTDPKSFTRGERPIPEFLLTRRPRIDLAAEARKSRRAQVALKTSDWEPLLYKLTLLALLAIVIAGGVVLAVRLL